MSKYNTQKIVEEISIYMQKNLLNSLDEEEYMSWPFSKWEEVYRRHEDTIKKIFPEAIHNVFPLRIQVLKLVTKILTGKMVFDKEYVLKHYERRYSGKGYLVFPSKSPKRMLILFSGFSPLITYNRYSWYWDSKERWDGETVYLFLNDPSGAWYVGKKDNSEKHIYNHIIKSVMREFGIKEEATFTNGGSMAGYAAIFYAFELGLRGAISVHPQISISGVKKHKQDVWFKHIEACGGNFVDLTDKVFHHDHTPFVYLEHGEYEADIHDTLKLIENLRKKECLVLNRKTSQKDHTTTNPTKETINSLIHFWENLGFKDQYIGGIATVKPDSITGD